MARRGLLLAFLALVAAAALSLTSVSVFAHSEEDFNATKQLVDSGVSCSVLTDVQLEEIGDYYMGQMHPGEAHELMDRMMGGEGSESLKQVHINMARRLYCNDNVYIGYGMMRSGGMMGMMNMISSGMMGSSYGMMGALYSSLSFNSTLFTIAIILSIIALALLIALLYKKVRKR